MIKSFTVGVKHHINLGSYESMEVEAQVTKEVKNDDYLDEARSQAQYTLKKILADTFEAQKRPAWFEEIPTKKRWVGDRTENG